MQYFMMRENDLMTVTQINGSGQVNWIITEEFDSPIAHCEIKEAT